MKWIVLPMLLISLTLAGCASSGGTEARYGAIEGERVIVVARADKTGFRTSANAGGLPAMATNALGGNGLIGAVASFAVGAAINSAGAQAPLLGFRTINEQTCQPVIMPADLNVQTDALSIYPTEYGEWIRVGSDRRLTLIPIKDESGKNKAIRRSHPCFTKWVEEWKIARSCLECRQAALFVWPGTEQPVPTFDWLEQ